MALTKFNYNSFDLTTAASKGLAFNSDADGFETSTSGSMTLIKTLTISSGTSTVSFIHGSSDVVFDSTYPVYVLKFINIHTPASNEQNFTVGFRDGGSDYDAVKTTTYFEAIHNEGDSATNLAYQASLDLAQSTSFSLCLRNLGTDNDQTASGEMYLFNPSSTTFVKLIHLTLHL